MATTIMMFIVSAAFFFAAFKVNELIPWKDIKDAFRDGYGAYFLIVIALFICAAFTGIVALVCVATIAERSLNNV